MKLNKVFVFENSLPRLSRRLLPLGGYSMLALLVGVGTAQAFPSRGPNCQSCHGTAERGMAMVNFQSTTNLGAGMFKVYKVTAGQTAAIGLNVTNNLGGNYGLTINNLTTATGVSNSTNKLSATADPTWANRTTYFTQGSISTSPNQWTFNLSVRTNTPADCYLLQAQMAGIDSIGNMWSQPESFYVQVVKPVTQAPPPSMMTPMCSMNKFSIDVSTVSGFTYYLEYKTSLTNANWTSAAQIAGDGTKKTLTNTIASDQQRFYRVRVQ